MKMLVPVARIGEEHPITRDIAQALVARIGGELVELAVNQIEQEDIEVAEAIVVPEDPFAVEKEVDLGVGSTGNASGYSGGCVEQRYVIVDHVRDP
jgi:hypothetical protein